MYIRPATYADVSAIATLHANSWRFAYRGALCDDYLATKADADRLRFWDERLKSPAPNQYVFLLCEGSEILGFVCVYPAHHTEYGSFLNNLHVAERHLGKGCGARLMLAASECFETLASNLPVYLFVVESNTRARAFYFRFNATLSGTDPWEPPDGGALVLHRLRWATPKDIRFAG
jgi:GNAT superfamily N-acetyltransferase